LTGRSSVGQRQRHPLTYRTPAVTGRIGIEVRATLNVGPFTAAQQNFLEYHRDMVLLKAAR
jgi:hypothetical protein